MNHGLQFYSFSLLLTGQLGIMTVDKNYLSHIPIKTPHTE